MVSVLSVSSSDLEGGGPSGHLWRQQTTLSLVVYDRLVLPRFERVGLGCSDGAIPWLVSCPSEPGSSINWARMRLTTRGEATLSRLEAVQSRQTPLRTWLGTSPAPTEHVQQVYDSRWNIFCTWCRSPERDPLTASAPLVAESLTHLSQARRRVRVTILAGYSSVRWNTIRISSEWSFWENSRLSSLLDSLCLERSRSRRTMHQWDLVLVIHLTLVI